MSVKFFSAKKLAALAVLTSLGLVTFIIENQFPPLFVPGAKMGLSNIFSLSALIMFGPAEGFIVVAVRTILGAMFSGNFSSVIYSFSGGMVSLLISAILLYAAYPRVSLIAISIIAAVAHNLTQNAIYALITSTTLMFAYMPYLALIGILSGLIVGAAVTLIFKKMPISVFEKLLMARTAKGTNSLTEDTEKVESKQENFENSEKTESAHINGDTQSENKQ